VAAVVVTTAAAQVMVELAVVELEATLELEQRERLIEAAVVVESAAAAEVRTAGTADLEL
jgi:hypothetical protein